MMCVVVFGHALLPYTTVPRRFEDPQTHVAFDVIAVFLYAFAMPAFFVTAGFAAAGLLNKRGARAFWNNRATRIFAPLVVGYIVLTPLTRAAHEFATATSLSGSLATGWGVFLEANWLRWSRAYHLWFLISLIVFSAGGVALQWLLQQLSTGLKDRLDTMARAAVLGPLRWLVLTAIIAALITPSYVTGEAPWTESLMQLAIFGFFCVGWLLYRYRDRIGEFAERWWLGPVLALAVTPLCGWASRQRLMEEGIYDLPMGLIAGTTNAIIAVFMTFGMLGIFQRFFSERGRFGQYVSDGSYWFYLIHYPVVVAAGGLLAVVDLPPPLKYLAVCCLSVPIIVGSYDLLVRRSPLGNVLGG